MCKCNALQTHIYRWLAEYVIQYMALSQLIGGDISRADDNGHDTKNFLDLGQKCSRGWVTDLKRLLYPAGRLRWQKGYRAIGGWTRLSLASSSSKISCSCNLHIPTKAGGCRTLKSTDLPGSPNSIGAPLVSPVICPTIKLTARLLCVAMRSGSGGPCRHCMTTTSVCWRKG